MPGRRSAPVTRVTEWARARGIRTSGWSHPGAVPNTMFLEMSRAWPNPAIHSTMPAPPGA